MRLQTVFRQKDGGRIVTNAHLINRGRLPVVDIGGEFQFLEITDEESGAVLISKLYAQEIKQTGDKFSVQVLSPMYRQECGVDHLNQLIQEQTNGAAPEKQEYKNGIIFFRVGDKVMQKKNDYDKGVFNGDIGEIYAIQQDMSIVLKSALIQIFCNFFKRLVPKPTRKSVKYTLDFSIFFPPCN